MMQKSDKPFKTALAAAMAHLKAKNIIKSGADVARDLGLDSRSTVSAYANGTTKMSGNFQTLFETKYGIELKKFEHMAEQALQVDPKKQDQDDPGIKVMYQQQMEIQKRILEDLGIIKVNLDKIAANSNRVSKEDIELLVSELTRRGVVTALPFALGAEKKKEDNSHNLDKSGKS